MFAFFLVIFMNSAVAKVDPPNYDFTLDTLKAYMPGSAYDPKKDKMKPTLYKGSKKTAIYLINITYSRYKFPMYLQVSDGVITDFYATLPTYFLDNLFHADLIKRYGKQDIFKKPEKTAVYVWKPKADRKVGIVYSSTCTVTCFPLFLTVIDEKLLGKKSKVKPLHIQFNDDNLYSH